MPLCRIFFFNLSGNFPRGHLQTAHERAEAWACVKTGKQIYEDDNCKDLGEGDEAGCNLIITLNPSGKEKPILI